MSLRARILLLVLFAMLTPALALAFFFVKDREADVAEAQRQLSVTAQRIAKDLEDVVRATAQLHYGLSRARELDSGDRAACSDFLAGVLGEFPQYTGILTIRPDGSLFCDSLRTGRTLDLTDRRYFQAALASSTPLALEPVFGRLTGIAVLQVAYAVRGDSGEPRFVLLASLNLEKYMLDRYWRLPFGSAVLALMDDKGTLLTWHPLGGEKLRGVSVAGSALHLLAQGRDDKIPSGEIEFGGDSRVWEAAGLPSFPETGLSVLIGVPKKALTASADQRLIRALVILALALLLAFAGAWTLAELGIRRPAARITEAVSRFRSGELGARIGKPYSGGELGGLMSAIDATADRIQAQNDEIRRLNEGLERRVAERTAQLEEANRAKSDFLANMSHELRTPLNSIIGFSEMLKEGVLGGMEAKQRGFVADIFNAGTHLLSLINDILDLSKVEAGMLEIKADAVDVAALLGASMMVVREKAAAHRIRLDTQLDAALGTMLADQRKLKQIVYNLLSNAVKFTAEGGTVTLRARRCARADVALGETLPGRLIPLPPGADNEFLAIAVEDTGVGIAEEHLPKLFEPFVQLDSSLARSQPGTGLGLSLVRRLAELHGGTVGVASRPGAGSRFSVFLPYRAAAPLAREERAAPPAHGLPAAPLALVVEDDDRVAEMITQELRAEGYEVMRAATGEEALVRAAKRNPHLITLDVLLPAMDGWEFMRRLKADPKLADIPVVIITVSQDQQHGLALGARRVLQKPFVRSELVEALAGLVNMQAVGAPARVLVVDDDVKAVELIATALEAEGCHVLRAYGGAEAIVAARTAPPDLVILDLMMPGVSGFEVATALRESEHTARIPILVLTAKDLSAEDHARLNDTVSVILRKSGFSSSELLAELRRALPRRKD